MSTKQEVMKLAKQMKISVEFSKDNFPGKFGRTHNDEITVEAPKGYHWVSSGTHELIVQATPGFRGIWNDVYTQMMQGTEVCNESTCPGC